MLWQSTAAPFSIIKLVGQNITTGHKKCHSLVEKCTGQPQKARQTIEENKEKEKESWAGGEAFKNVAALEMLLCQPEK